MPCCSNNSYVYIYYKKKKIYISKIFSFEKNNLFYSQTKFLRKRFLKLSLILLLLLLYKKIVFLSA